MADTQAMIGKGTKYEVETYAGSGVFFKVGEVKGITPPAASVGDAEATNMDSDAEEFVPAFTNYGTSQLVLNWIPGGTSDEFIEQWRESGERRLSKITFKNGAWRLFRNYVQEYSGEIPLKDVMTATLNTKITSTVTRGNS